MCIIHITWSEKELLFLTSTDMQQTTLSQRTWTKGSVHKAVQKKVRWLLGLANHVVERHGIQQKWIEIEVPSLRQAVSTVYHIIFDLRSQVAKIPSPKSNVPESCNHDTKLDPPKNQKGRISNLTKFQAGLCLAWHNGEPIPTEVKKILAQILVVKKHLVNLSFLSFLNTNSHLTPSANWC